MDIDPVAVVRPRPVVVTVGGKDYRIDARPAAGWMVPILEKDWADIVPGMLDAALTGTLDDLYDALADGEVESAQCARAAQDALTITAGVPWWSAVKLIHAASADPGAIGELRLSGIDLTTAPLGAVVAALYRIYTRDREKKDVTKFDAELARTPVGVSAVDSRYDEQAAANAFESMFARRGGH